MSVYIVSGTHGVGKSTVANLAIKKLGKDIRYVCYGDVVTEVFKEKGIRVTHDEIRRWIETNWEEYKEIQRKAAQKIASHGGDIIVDTHTSLKIKTGYYPGLPEWVIEALQPKVIILIEADPEEVDRRRGNDGARQRNDFGGPEQTAEHQFMNRVFAVAVSQECGATVKIIQNHDGKQEQAAEELKDVMLEGMR